MSDFRTRKVYVEMTIEEPCDLEEGEPTIVDALENESGFMENSGVTVENFFISDEDDEEPWCQYISYLMNWCLRHTNPELRYKHNNPMSYEQWVDERCRREQQIKEARNNEACCVSDSLIGSLGKRSSEDNGDRCSMYEKLAVYNGEVFFVTLVERKAGLPKAKWYYEIRFISGYDFHNRYLDNYLEFYTDTLSEEELQNRLYWLIEQIETGEFAKAMAGQD